jgi:hypothetical protein
MSPKTNSKIQECEKDYSTYMGWMQNQKGTYGFICGFTFTAITLLIISLPDPNSILSQLIMLFLTIVFDLLLYLILLIGVESLKFCKDVPLYDENLKLCNTLSDLVFVLWGFTIPLIFLLWKLHYLAISSTVIWIIFILISNFTIVKQFKQYRKITISKQDTDKRM